MDIGKPRRECVRSALEQCDPTARTGEVLGDDEHFLVATGHNCQAFFFFAGFDLPELLRATAWRMSVLKADSSTSSASWISIARRTLPSRLELKRRAGSFRDAPLANVSFTTLL